MISLVTASHHIKCSNKHWIRYKAFNVGPKNVSWCDEYHAMTKRLLSLITVCVCHFNRAFHLLLRLPACFPLITIEWKSVNETNASAFIGIIQNDDWISKGIERIKNVYQLIAVNIISVDFEIFCSISKAQFRLKNPIQFFLFSLVSFVRIDWIEHFEPFLSHFYSTPNPESACVSACALVYLLESWLSILRMVLAGITGRKPLYHFWIGNNQVLDIQQIDMTNLWRTLALPSNTTDKFFIQRFEIRDEEWKPIFFLHVNHNKNKYWFRLIFNQFQI